MGRRKTIFVLEVSTIFLDKITRKTESLIRK